MACKRSKITNNLRINNPSFFDNIEIKDNGFGMSKDEVKHIFNRFYRISTGDRHDVKGFGLGLNYVKLMTEKHNGSITADSEINKGTTFTLQFPIKRTAL